MQSADLPWRSGRALDKPRPDDSRRGGRTRRTGRFLIVTVWTLALLSVTAPLIALTWGVLATGYAAYLAWFEETSAESPRLLRHSPQSEQAVRALYTPIWAAAPMLAAFGGHPWGVLIAMVMLGAAILMLISNYSGPPGLPLGRGLVYSSVLLVVVASQWGSDSFMPAVVATLLMAGATGSTLVMKRALDRVVSLRAGLATAQQKSERLALDLEKRNVSLEFMHREAERVAELRAEFVANVVHEIRTPLSAVLGLTDALMRTPMDPRQTELVLLIHSSNEGLLRLSNDVLDVAKIDAGELVLRPAPFDVQRELEAATIVARGRCADKGLVLEISATERVRRNQFWGDAMRLRQIVSNLAGNASKFTEAGRVQVGADFCASGDETGEMLQITVTDTGPGLDTEFQHRIFRRFAQSATDHATLSEGAGLGLSIVKSLVDLMGGHITFLSEPGRGCTFTVRLPFEIAPVAEEGERTSDLTLPTRPMKTGAAPLWRSVLIVDDSVASRRVLSLMLEAVGVVPAVASSGEEAVIRFRERHFELVLVDMRMAGLSGDETVAQLRSIEAQSDRAPGQIVIMSAGESTDTRGRSMRAGADDFLLKPITPQDLGRLMQRTATRP